MLPEISLNILDIAENSVKAGASCIEIGITILPEAHTLSLRIRDNGCGMNGEQLRQVTDPFFTSRTTRKVGLGIPFLKQAAELTGGSFSISSEPGQGTLVEALFRTDSIDCMPLGNAAESVYTLLLMHEEIRFLYRYQVGEEAFTLDTEELREILGEEISYQEPEVAEFIRSYLTENSKQVERSQLL